MNKWVPGDKICWLEDGQLYVVQIIEIVEDSGAKLLRMPSKYIFNYKVLWIKNPDKSELEDETDLFKVYMLDEEDVVRWPRISVNKIWNNINS